MVPSLKDTLAQLTAVQGVKEAFLYSREEGSMEPHAAEASSWAKAAATIAEQLFSALRTISRSHDEICFQFDDRLIAAYEMSDSTLLLLAVEPQFNASMVDLGLKSASPKPLEAVSSES